MTYHELVNELKINYEMVDASNIAEHFAIQYNITGEAEGALYVEIAEGDIDVQPYEYDDRDIIITTDYQTAVDISERKISLLRAYRLEKVNVWGDFDKAVYIDEHLRKKNSICKKG